MKLQTITPEEVAINSAGDYNIRIWKETIRDFKQLNATFYMSDERSYSGSNVFYVVYIADGIRFIQKLSFSYAIDSQPLELVTFDDIGNIVYSGAYYPKTNQGRRLMRRMTELSDKAIFQ